MSSDRPHRVRRWILLGLAAVALVFIGAVGGYLLTREGDVSNPDVEFRAEPTPTPITKDDDSEAKVDTFAWPVYGFTQDRRTFLPASPSMRPPFRKLWTRVSSALIEFPPVMARNSLYVLNDKAVLYAIVKRTGHVRWKKRLGYLSASSPAVAHSRLFVTLLQRTPKGRTGRVVALSASSGKILWSRDLPSRSESSPLIDGGTIYFGSESGHVYALKASNGEVRWTYKARGAVKGGIALSEGRLVFGDYAGKVYALRQSDGKELWQASTKGARFGLSAGRFYSTPAIAYGRVYAGNVDGYVYSFSAATGKLAWRTKTSGYVYASPSVGQAPGDKPTVYAGSYDGTFYAFDARSGKVRWRHHAAGKISGGSTLLGDIVYFADLGNRRTIGLGARTGRKVFEFPRGGYNPVISDGRTLFLVGYATLHALRPLSTKEEQKVTKRRRATRKARAARVRRAEKRDDRLRQSCRSRAERLHDRHGEVVRSYRRCVDRRRAKATREACRRRAIAAHGKNHQARVKRSTRRCVARRRR